MTIKRQIFISNIRTVLVTLVGLFLLGFIVQFVTVGIIGIDIKDDAIIRDQVKWELEDKSQGVPGISGLIFFVFFCITYQHYKQPA
jgi:hypothetical protein